MVVILIGTLKLTWIGPSITMITWIVGTPYPVATLPEVIGDGKSINFWCNTWLPHMVGEALNLPGRISSSLKYTVSDFLHNGSWNLTPFLQICALNLVAGIVQMDILISHRPNELIWEKYDSRSLTLKIAFNFLCGNDILLKRGCTIVSQCNLCCSTLKPPSTSFFSAICSFSLELAFKHFEILHAGIFNLKELWNLLPPLLKGFPSIIFLGILLSMDGLRGTWMALLKAHEMTGNYRGAREGGEGENEVIDSKSVVCEAMDLRCESIFKFEA
ncbi:hypothetical protein JHK85_027958 [Glycine max]|nr:hypothetical protein JHK85_027958 [Glycine max]